MKTNMKEELLMAYLYGELSAAERQEVEKTLETSPEDLKNLQEMRFVKDALGQIADKEVIAPPIFMDEKPTISLWQSPIIRYSIGIAAALFIVMVGARMVGLQMQSSPEGLLISFGETKSQPQSTSLTPEQIQQMINASLATNNSASNTAWQETQSKLNETMKQNVLLASQKINEANKNSLSTSQEEIRQFMESLRTQNSQALQEYIRLSSNDQKQYIENLLVDFSKYVQEQRSQDLNLVNTRLNTLEQDNNLFREEAGQILTSLISNENNSGVKRN